MNPAPHSGAFLFSPLLPLCPSTSVPPYHGPEASSGLVLPRRESPGSWARILLPPITATLGFSLPSHGSCQGLCMATSGHPGPFASPPAAGQLLPSPLAEVFSGLLLIILPSGHNRCPLSSPFPLLSSLCFIFSTTLSRFFFFSPCPLGLLALVTATLSAHRSSGTLWPMPTTP